MEEEAAAEAEVSLRRPPVRVTEPLPTAMLVVMRATQQRCSAGVECTAFDGGGAAALEQADAERAAEAAKALRAISRGKGGNGKGQATKDDGKRGGRQEPTEAERARLQRLKDKELRKGHGWDGVPRRKWCVSTS